MVDREYFLRRQAEEEAAANRARDERVRRCHRDLALAYRRAADHEAQPELAEAENAVSSTPADFRIL